MSLKSQKRMVAGLLKVGMSRVWIDPEQIDKVETAITKNELRKLIHEGIIQSKPKMGISRDRSKKKRKGPGSRKGPSISKKRIWIRKIRALRKALRELVGKRLITKATYRKLSAMTKGGTFRSTAHLKEHMETHKLLRRK